MNRQLAKQIAEKVTLEDLKQMFVNAKNETTDWTKVSNVNLGMTKGTAYNILSIKKEYTSINEIHIMGRINMIREFGEFLPNLEIYNPPKPKKEHIKPVHQEPKFDITDW